MDLLVSICIPTYNQTVFLKKSLDSIKEQTYNNIEVVITDDSSTNDVNLLVAAYKDHLRIKYHKNRSALGSPANWNKGLDMAEGEFIKIMHHDDWLATPAAIEKFVGQFKKEPHTEMVFCDSKILNVEAGYFTLHQPDRAFVNRLKRDPTALFNDNQVGSPSAVMYRKNTLRFDENIKYLVDVDFYIRLLQQKNNFRYIAESLIINTANHSQQVTASSLNKETQIREYCYLYMRTFDNKIPSKELSRFFIRLFKKYHIKNLAEIKTLGVDLKPSWYFRLLLLLSKLKNI